ncbi:MAG: DEAD/DEAH box helicase [Flavobacteriales bacterium]|nr:DEAD/DEAH box helicase [Flavobacteriales bacterium]
MLNFELLGLSKPVMRAIAELGFETPTPIQEQAIPVMLGGNQDVVALAQTGTGKTAAFGLPLVDLLNFDERHTQALILAPTRELCMQITRDLQNFSKYMNGAQVTAIYGGASIEGQIRDVRKGPQIIAATPGRLVDMIERGVVDLSKIDFVVLDEADEMLTMGFKDDLDLILSQTPKEKNTWLFSATMPHEVQRIARNYMHEPHEVTIGQKNSGNENIEHQFYVVHAKDRYLALKRIADFNPDIFAIVFCRTKAETQTVADALIKDGYNADSLHGDLSQAQRDFVMKRYRSRSLQMLVATDVAARGIDVNDVTHVINYNLPDEIESYTHRSGRTARAGKTGVSIAIIHTKEMHKIREIEKLIKRKFTQAQIPSGFDVCESQLLSLVKKVHSVEVDEKSIERYLPAVFSELEELSREDIIKRFVSIEFNRFAEYYRNAPDLNLNAQGDERRKSAPGVVKMYINVGQMDGFDFNSLKDFIAENAEISNGDVTWTDVKNTFSLLEVRTEVMEKIIQSIHGAQYRGRTVRVESRGNRDAGIPRTRLRSDNRREGGGGYGGGGGRSYDKGSRYSDGGNRKSYGGRSGGGDRDRSSSKGKKKKSY